MNKMLTPEQAISYFMMKIYWQDYIEYLDYDCFDWREWNWLRRN